MADHNGGKNPNKLQFLSSGPRVGIADQMEYAQCKECTNNSVLHTIKIVQLNKEMQHILPNKNVQTFVYM